MMDIFGSELVMGWYVSMAFGSRCSTNTTPPASTAAVLFIFLRTAKRTFGSGQKSAALRCSNLTDRSGALTWDEAHSKEGLFRLVKILAARFGFILLTDSFAVIEKKAAAALSGRLECRIS